ncbi:MAG: flagellar biosynthesis protein FlgN [Spirochaetales bacterium]
MVLTKEEVDRRVALLKRLKTTLLAQREKFRNYMLVLDAEKSSIENDKVDTLRLQVELEENLVAEIHTFQKVIDPLEAVWKQSYPLDHDVEVVELKATLANLKSQVLEKNEKNRTLLSARMAQVQGEILRLRPNVRGRNPYTGQRSVSTLVDITT